VDALSRLLTLYPPRGKLDLRCHLGAPWSTAHDAARPGIVPYHIMIGGQATLEVAGHAPLLLEDGDIVVFPHGAAHTLSAVPAIPSSAQLPVSQAQAACRTDMLCGQFEFDPLGGRPLFGALPDLLLVRSAGADDFDGLAALIAMLRLETINLRAGAGLIVSELSSVLFALLMRAWLQQPGQRQGWLGLLAERRLQPALQGMLETPGQAWSLAQLATRCHMSRATFVRLFQQVASVTPAATLLQIRMAAAAQALAQTARSLGAIGEAVGYQSEAAFSRVFKKTMGMGPGQYRRQALHPAAMEGS
jgi:AraC family transcriptional activator of mtrCDE